MDDGWPQIAGAFLLDEPRAIASGGVGYARSLQVLLDLLPNGGAHSGHGECGEAGFGVCGRQRLDRSETFGESFGDFARVPRCPDSRAIDAAAAAVDVDAFDHEVEIFGPAVDDIVAQQDLREARAVCLDLRIASVSI